MERSLLAGCRIRGRSWYEDECKDKLYPVAGSTYSGSTDNSANMERMWNGG